MPVTVCGYVPPASHLVEQRLEQVMVGAVDERDLDLGARQRTHRRQAAEAAADDHHARTVAHSGPVRAGWPCSRLRTRWMLLRSAYSSST